MKLNIDNIKARLLPIDPNSAMGSDGIHSMVLRSCAKTLAHPLSIIFQHSLDEGIVPSLWKKSIMIPIFKKGHHFEPLNYRPDDDDDDDLRASPLHRRPLVVSLSWVLGNWEMEKDRDSASTL